MNKPVGGRGKRADYDTEMIRIPSPIKDRVLELKRMFYENQLDFHDECIARDAQLAREYEAIIRGEILVPEKIVNLISSNQTNDVSAKNLSSSLEEVKTLAKLLIEQNKTKKRSVKELIAKLISSLFHVEVSKDEL
jgi:hypothetical protein